ncbi:MAG: energy transducer TonB [Opitutae bacterium]|nr:energy transducer TonB [Opitutae bacterium]
MKNIKTLLLATGLLTASLAFAAKSPERAYVESYQGRPDTPVPLSVLSPEVDNAYAGETVVLDFVVDAQGAPTAITARGAHPPELVAAVVHAVARWKFTPLQRQGESVPTRVVLPVKITDWRDRDEARSQE